MRIFVTFIDRDKIGGIYESRAAKPMSQHTRKRASIMALRIQDADRAYVSSKGRGDANA